MNQESVEDFTNKLVIASSNVLERFMAGHHPSTGQLEMLERALFPFVGEKLCGHKIVDDCECLAEVR